uniref:Uncharacterized protein n=1 Tax=Pinguiococcus pyrenoidosus TaxID=172671 RepID=A0A7R9UH18_9STRA|mmetsp:Transcript_8127/g.30540  ORF Transcript_8127/g.30540 Transcript_8127/m.30540 type:complete len:107 (+) Transcript_8127:182-502(+)
MRFLALLALLLLVQPLCATLQGHRTWLVRGGKTVKVEATDGEEQTSSKKDSVSLSKPGPAKVFTLFWLTFFDPTYEEQLKPKKKLKSKGKSKKPKISGTGYKLGSG